MNNESGFFLGANTPEGFYSLFDELYNARDGWKAYIIKGGPGTGKSGMMKTIAQKCAEEGIFAEKIWCSSDPQSLDGLIFHDLKVCVADGTPPHTIEPKFPGACETLINLGSFWRTEMIERNREKIIELTLKNSSAHKRCIRFMSAAHSLQRDVERIAMSCVDTNHLERYASRLSAKKFGLPRGQIGIEQRRFLSAITPEGIVFGSDTVNELCSKIYVLEDEHGAVSTYLMDLLRRYALGNGLDVISCLCPLNPDSAPEHLIIPEIGLGFVTSNSSHHLCFAGASSIRASRFTDTAALREHKCRISFSRRTVNELIAEAIVSMEQALEIHDELEKYYIEAMDFDRVRETGEKIADEIISAG